MNRLLSCLAAVAASTLVTAAHAQPTPASFPTGPIRYVVPAPPGGLIDTMARLVEKGMRERLKQNVVIDNKPGAGTVLGAQEVAKASPDGHTWLAVSISLAANTAIPGAKFDAEKSLIPVARLAVTPMGMAVPANSPYNSLQDVVKASKSGKTFNVGSSGNGTPSHLALALFEGLAKVDMTHVPYKGGAPALVDLIAGQTDLVFVTLQEAQQYIKGGKLKLLAVINEKRVADFPNVPTSAEAGLPGMVMTGWTGIMVPAGTPQPTIQRIADAAIAVASQPEFVKQAEGMGFVMATQGPADFGKFFKDEVGRLKVLIKERQVKMD